jgi:hypothetical protein
MFQHVNVYSAASICEQALHQDSKLPVQMEKIKYCKTLLLSALIPIMTTITPIC